MFTSQFYIYCICIDLQEKLYMYKSYSMWPFEINNSIIIVIIIKQTCYR